jgi:hypothetical protein
MAAPAGVTRCPYVVGGGAIPRVVAEFAGRHGVAVKTVRSHDASRYFVPFDFG